MGGKAKLLHDLQAHECERLDERRSALGKEEVTVLGGGFFLFYTSRQTAPILSFKLYLGTDMSQASESIVGGLTGRNQQFTLLTAPVLV